jgi:hypothetical protein
MGRVALSSRLLPAALRPWHGAALVALLGLLVYGRCAGFTLVTGDDWSLVAGNRNVTRWAEAPLRARLLTVEFGYPIPVTVASFALDWALWPAASRAAGLHLTNVLLHIACALCLLRLLRRATGMGAALAGALLFLLHPAQVEAVAFVTGRKDLLATLLSLLALGGLIDLAGLAGLAGLADRSGAARGGPRPAAIARTTALVLLAGLSKPSAVLIGPVLAAGWLVLRGRPRRRGEWVLLALLSGAGAALLLLNVLVHRLNPVSLDGGASGSGRGRRSSAGRSTTT